MSIAVARRVTPDELLTLPDDGRLFELVNGELVEKLIGFREVRIANRIARIISDYAVPRRLGDA
jgi:hypothetical protein